MNEETNHDRDFEADFEFDDELNEFDDFGYDDAALTIRTVILMKESMLALLCIKSASKGAAICRVDPREAIPAVQLYDDPEAAHHWFSKSLRTSRNNGWQTVYDGLPLRG